MKQKFYSQVNMECIFFFESRACDWGREAEGGKHEIWHHRRGPDRQDPRRQRRRAPRQRGGLRRRRGCGRRGRLGQATGAKVADIDAILAAKDVDAVAICSPTDTHADLIERAARARKAIFCEKPIDLDVERVRACLDVVKQTGATLMVGFNRRFDPNFASLARDRRGRDRRARNRLDHLAAIPGRRRSPISPAPAACFAT